MDSSLYQRNMEGVSFVGDRVEVDNTSFKNCRFENAVLVFKGTGPVGFDSCVFNNVTWGLEGAASATIEFLTALHASGIFMPLIYQVIGHITGGKKISGKPE